MPEEDKRLLVEQKRKRVVPVVPPENVQVNGGGEYLDYPNALNAGTQQEPVDEATQLPAAPATPMGVGGDNKYASGADGGRSLPGTTAMNDAFGDSWSLTPEQEEERMRKAKTSAMIGNLGNVMSAFANLYYTGKGAPSQQVPDAVVPDYMKFQDRVNQARKDALANQMAREKMAADYALKNRQQDWIEKYQAGLLDLKAEQNRINEEYRKGQISIQEQRAATDALRAMAADVNAKTNAARLAWQQQPEYHETTETDKYGNTKTKRVTKGRDVQGGANTGKNPKGTLLPNN